MFPGRKAQRKNQLAVAWHALNQVELLQKLSTALPGLSQAEAEQRLTKYGANILTPAAGRGPIKRFFSQFHNVLIYLLIGSAAISWLIGERIDSLVIFVVILANAIIGFIQEGKAEKALASIRKMLTSQANVYRNGKNAMLPAEQLVPGDIVLLESGDKVPADIRLLKVKNLHIDESMLTGESVPVKKDCELYEPDVALADRRNMAYSGTLVTYGTALGVTVSTGDNTELGQINRLLKTGHTLKTPLLHQIAIFSRWLTLSILLVSALIFAYGWYVKHTPPTELFMAVISLAVAAIPEGLPAIMTITLAIGVQQMAKRNAIIRRLPAVETLGSVSVICTDKTGTLTRNEMTVKSVCCEGNLYVVEGAGYDPDAGKIKFQDEIIKVNNYPALENLIKAGTLCNNSAVLSIDGAWQIQGDPTEAALVTLALKAGFQQDSLKREAPRLDAIPFESEYSYMATLHAEGMARVIYVKGAPEIVLSLCQLQLERGLAIPIEREKWLPLIHRLAACGQRVMAMAYKTAQSTQDTIDHADLKSDLIFLGIVGMADPPRTETFAAVKTCQDAGIRVKMITGDHAVTALSIAEQIAIGHSNVLRGEEIDQMSDEALKAAANTIDVFARVSPESKLRLVAALQATNHVVAMTGDGVNDAPALQSANVGIAMGQKGTEVAKEASEMVLADDNFATIAKAVEAGRGIYDNLKKAILFILPTGVAEGLMVAVAIFIGDELPINPLQILWVNTVTEITLSLALALEKPEGNVMARKPRKINEPLLSGFLIWRLLIVSLVMVGGTYWLFHWAYGLTHSIEMARTVSVNTLVMFEVVYVFNSRYLLNSVLSWKGIFGSAWIWLAVGLLTIAQAGLTYWPAMQALFGTASLAWHIWPKILAVALSLFILVELEKFVIRAILPKFRKAEMALGYLRKNT